MDKDNLHEGVTEFQLMQLYAEFKAEIAALKTFVKMSIRKPSERLADEWISSQQVMKLLNITKGTLQGLRDKETLPFTTICGKIYYKSNDVAALLNSNYKMPPRKVKSNQGADH